MYPSVRDAMTLQAFPNLEEGLRSLGLDAVEIDFTHDCTVHAVRPSEGKARFKLDSPAAVEEYGKHLQQTGVRVSTFLMHNNFGSDDFDGEVNLTITAVKAAAQLGIPAIRIDAIMRGERDQPMEKNVAVFADAMAMVLDATANTRVDLGIENHGFQGNMPEFLDSVLTKVGSSRVGITIDTGNFYWRGHPLSKVYQIIEHFAPHCKHTHVKNIAYPEDKREIQRDMGWEYGKYVCPIPDGDIDHRRVVKILKAAGYDRDLCIEDESLGKYSPEERKTVLKKDADYVKEILRV